MMSSVPCFLITTSVCNYLGIVQAITGAVYRFLISTCKLHRILVKSGRYSPAQVSASAQSPVLEETQPGGKYAIIRFLQEIRIDRHIIADIVVCLLA